MSESVYIKALSVRNTADMVYARQCFHEVGMLPGKYMEMVPGGCLVVPDGGWIVWIISEGAIYTVRTDEEFRALYIPYAELPQAQKRICDAHPDYDEWCGAMDRAFEAKEKAPC